MASSGGLLCSTAYFVASEIKSTPLFLVVYGGLLGIGAGMVYIPGAIALGFYFETWRPFAAALSACGTSLGILVLPFVIEKSLKRFDWRFKFKLLGGCSVVVGFLCCLYLPLLPRRVTPTVKKKVVFILTDDRTSATTLPVAGPRLSRYHNALYPTIADIHSAHGFSYNLEQPNRLVVDSLSSPGASYIIAAGSIQFMTPSAGLRSRLSGVSEVEESCCGRCVQRCCHFVCCCCVDHEEYITSARPLYRDDIFYTGSRRRLAEYAEVPTPI